jgi:transposase
MTSIISKEKKGNTYYYAVRSQRVNGAPRIVWQKYLGTADAIVKRTEDSRPPRPKEAVVCEAGAVAALYRIAQRLELVETIDRHVPKRDQGPSVGQYLLLASINRALAPRSKRQIGAWYANTSLARWWGFPEESFTSQRFWDHMDLVPESVIPAIEEDVARTLVSKFDIELGTLFYDTTNFFTYIDSFNDRSTLAQRGKNKAHRNHLRQIGLALLVSGNFHVPVLHRTYAGQLNDATQFKVYCVELADALERITGEPADVTFVFDKGNISEEAFTELRSRPLHFVTAVRCRDFPDLLSVPLEEYRPVETDDWPGVRSHRCETMLHGEATTAVLAFSETLYTQQFATITRELAKCVTKLTDLADGLKEWQAGKRQGSRPTEKSVAKRVAEILSPQHMKDLVKTEITSQSGFPRLRFATDPAALTHLVNTELGRNFLVTDHIDWSAVDVIRAYRGQYHVEDAFRDMNQLDFLHFRPQFHWTDQKVRVHAFYCVLALMLITLLRRELFRGGLEMSTHEMLDDLTKIKEVAVIYPQGTMAHRKDHVTLSRTSKRQKQMIELLDLSSLLPERG